jgi:hypothetical protein
MVVGESDLDRPMSRLSVLPESATSANDLRLGRRVLELEKERDVMAVSPCYTWQRRRRLTSRRKSSY